MIEIGLSLSTLGLRAARFATRARALELFVFDVALRLIVAQFFIVENDFFVAEQLNVFVIIVAL